MRLAPLLTLLFFVLLAANVFSVTYIENGVVKTKLSATATAASTTCTDSFTGETLSVTTYQKIITSYFLGVFAPNTGFCVTFTSGGAGKGVVFTQPGMMFLGTAEQKLYVVRFNGSQVTVNVYTGITADNGVFYVRYGTSAGRMGIYSVNMDTWLQLLRAINRDSVAPGHAEWLYIASAGQTDINYTDSTNTTQTLTLTAFPDIILMLNTTWSARVLDNFGSLHSIVDVVDNYVYVEDSNILFYYAPQQTGTSTGTSTSTSTQTSTSTSTAEPPPPPPEAPSNSKSWGFYLCNPRGSPVTYKIQFMVDALQLDPNDWGREWRTLDQVTVEPVKCVYKEYSEDYVRSKIDCAWGLCDIISYRVVEGGVLGDMPVTSELAAWDNQGTVLPVRYNETVRAAQGGGSGWPFGGGGGFDLGMLWNIMLIGGILIIIVVVLSAIGKRR